MSLSVEGASGIIQNATQTVETVGAVSQVLEAFNKLKDQVMPGNELENLMKEVDDRNNHTSKEGALIIGEIKTLTMTAMDKYHRSTGTIYGWCDTASQLLKIYVKLFNQNDKNTTALKQDILDKVLSGGINKMNEAQTVLQNCSENFNQAAGKFIALETLLVHQSNERKNLSGTQTIAACRKACAIAAVAIFTPFVAIYLLNSAVRESSTRAEMESLQRESTKYFLEKVKIAISDIDDKKKKLADEIRVIEDLKSHNNITNVIMPYHSNEERSGIVLRVIKQLIDQCDVYCNRHSNKNNYIGHCHLRLRDIVIVLLYMILCISLFCFDFYSQILKNFVF